VQLRSQAVTIHSCIPFVSVDFVDAESAELTSDSGLLVAAEWGKRIEACAVDVDLSGADSLGDSHRSLLISAPDRTG
jgi:hypothetical protein